MNYKKIIIIGASGFIGNHLFRYFKNNEIETYGTYYGHKKEGLIEFNLLQDTVSSVFDKYITAADYNNTAVILCSANSSIDKCKIDETASYNLNVVNTKRIIDEIRSLGMKLVFLSSEAIFDGKQGYYKETDIPNPITVYGKQKLEVEQYILKHISNALVLRISRTASGILGESDIFNEFYNKMKSNQTISCIKGQSFCLTDVEDICEGIFKAVNYGLSGIYHLSSENYVTRYELGLKYAGRFFPEYNLLEERELNTFSFVDGRHIKGGLNGKKLASMLKIRYKTLDEIFENCSI